MGETSAGPVSLCSALRPVTTDAITCAAIGMIEGRRSHQSDRANAEVTIAATGWRRTMTEAAAAPVGLRGALHSVTALAVTGAGNRMIEGLCADRTVWTTAGMTAGAAGRRRFMREETVAPPDARAVVAACAITCAAGVVRKTVHHRGRALCRMALGTTAGVGFVAVCSTGPGHSGAANVAGRAIADARIGVEHLVHKRGGLRRGMTVETRRRCRRVAEGAEDPPACSAGHMTLPAVLATTMDHGSSGSGIEHRCRPVESMAAQAADIRKGGVIRNDGFSRSMNRLG